MGYEKTNPPRVKSLKGPKFSKGAGRRHFKTEDSNEFPCRQDRAAASCRPITPTGGNYQLELALYYAGAGIPLHPVHPTAKCPPRGSHGKNDATTNEAQIRAWWKRYPDALVSILTGSQTGIFVLDVDGESGRRSLNELLTLFNFERIEDLTCCIVRSRSGGLHLYFRLRSGERPRSRAGDIAPGLDTKGEGGSIIAPGNRVPDGREYRWIGPRADLAEASAAPAALIYLATFGARNRDEIANDPDLSDAIKVANAGEWPGIFEQHQKTQAARMMARMEAEAPDLDGMRAQAASDIREAAAAYAELADGPCLSA